MQGFTARENRTIEVGQKVRVYKNLNNGLWSIQCMKKKHVLGYAEEITLKGCEKQTFKVNEGGRQKVLKDKQKNVHAYIIGYVENFVYEVLDEKVYYNPYTCKQFVSGTKEVYKAERISMESTTSTVYCKGVQ